MISLLLQLTTYNIFSRYVLSDFLTAVFSLLLQILNDNHLESTKEDIHKLINIK